MSFQPVLSDSEIGEMKAHLRAMERKRDEIAITIAKTLNFPSIWTVKMINWNNPEIAHFKEEFQNLEQNIYTLTWQIEEAEATLNGTIDYFNAKVKAYGFLYDNFNNFEDEIEFFMKNGLTRGMSSLIDEIYKNPDYLSEVVL